MTNTEMRETVRQMLNDWNAMTDEQREVSPGGGCVTTRADLLAALTAHERVRGFRDLRQHCSCGWESEERATVAAWREHVADHLSWSS